MNKKEIENAIKKRISESPKKFIPFTSLENLGLKRYQCKKCGKHFWASSERELCGDVDCTGAYTFIEKPITKKSFGYKELWERFSKMFEKSGHEEIKRYPVVARWRDDIFFVEAAIDDFAPYVIQGLVEPPANPLTVPQICIRFNDVKNIGLTGRHLTSFIMAEEAAFNTHKKKTYFDKEAITYIAEWLLKGLEINREDLTFVEDAWAGAGYAGNSLEFFGGGVELGNSVFMRYILEGGSLRDIETKTIDMGAGLDRWAWISQRTPTVYEAVMPKVVQYIKKKAGIDYDDNVLKRIYTFLGNTDFETTSLTAALNVLSKRLDTDVKGLNDVVRRMQAVYSIADHTRTLLVTMHDGALPSNVGGGYNLRNILRRALNFITENHWDIDLNDVIEEHKKEFGGWFKELNDYDLTQIINKEIERHAEFKTRNSKFISSVLNKERISEEQAMELYTSKGITLDDIEHQARIENKEISLPRELELKPNKVMKRHDKENTYDTSGLPETETLFYDEGLTETTAKVLRKLDKNIIVLNRTIFYPEMGGQKADHGLLGGHHVIDVQKENGIILHFVDADMKIKEGETVKLELDTNRRELLKRHHTATHIINQACRRILGGFVYQNGAEKDVDKARLDITYYDKLSDEQLTAIERLANDVVAKNMKIEATVMDRTSAERLYGMSIYQGGAVPSAKLRIVKIDDYDVEACGGIHCDHTGEVGFIKITKMERIQDGVVRLTFVAYRPAVEYAQRVDRTVKDLSRLWGVEAEDVYKTAERFFSEWKRYKEEYERTEIDRLHNALRNALAGKDKKIELKTSADNLGIIMAATIPELPALNGTELLISSSRLGIGYPKTDIIKKELTKKFKAVVEKGEFWFGYNN